MSVDAEITRMIREACARYDALTPEQKAEHDAAQRESFIRAMGPCEHGVRDFETCQKCREASK